MATDLTTTEAQVPAPTAPAQHAPAPKSNAPHRGRFVVIYVTLAAVLGVAVVGVVIYAGRSINPAPTWSAWKPSGGGLGASKQIASHVAGTYHLPSGQQLVDVIAEAPSVSPDATQVVPIHFLALRGPKGVIHQVVPIDSSNAVTYSLCGAGTSCTIAGTPTAERGTLVRREILELALYTFKYVGGVDNVIAYMPPAAGAPQGQQARAVYLEKSDLSQQLKHPIAQTLNTKVPLPAAITAKDQQSIDTTTLSRVYKFNVQRVQQGELVLFLQTLA